MTELEAAARKGDIEYRKYRNCPCYETYRFYYEAKRKELGLKYPIEGARNVSRETNEIYGTPIVWPKEFV